jgi:ABC-type Fe3+/spermidine/putrescine transport system ATPase subunit
MLEVKNVWKSYEGKPLLCDISLTVDAGETICLLGPSGSGKSTLLRIIAGLEALEHGRICWDGRDLTAVPTHKRNFGMVFQDYALFPHLTVAQNVAFGLKMQGLSSLMIDQRVTEALEQVNLSAFKRRRVTDLSGGEQQRVALARALAPQPRLLMLDEPLGALDRTLRDHLLNELRGILHMTGVPAIYVTHDQEEAFAIADRLLLLYDGKVIRSGSPSEVWSEPGSVWVARFLGLGNLVEGRVNRDIVETPFGRFRPVCGHKHTTGELVTLLLRPEGAEMNNMTAMNSLTGIVADVVFHQEDFKVTLEDGLYFYLSEALRIGARIHLRMKRSAVQCLPNER